MPELPEVETIVRDLRKKVLGLTITGLKAYDGRVIRQKSIAEFSRRLKNRSIENILRRGKAIIMELDGGPSTLRFHSGSNTERSRMCSTLDSPRSVTSRTIAQDFLVVQLMMTGQLICTSSPIPTRDTKVIFKLSNGDGLHYNDYRMFGRLQVVAKLDEIPYFSRLGPEPLENDFTVGWLRKELSNRKKSIKPLLLDHTFVAGIGNIYASEILFVSGINPRRPAASLAGTEITVLHRNIRGILKEAIRYRGTSMNTYRDTRGQKGTFINHIHVYGREKEECLSCRTNVVREFQSGRSTFYCPQCQK